MQNYIISLGGSLIVPDGIDSNFLKKFKELIEKHTKESRFIIICGGGKTARRYQEAASAVMQLAPEDKDWIGIHSTRLNGQLVKTLFKKIAYPKVIRDPTEKIKLKDKERVVIAAGWKPGASTDYDAVLLAKNFGVKALINLTNVDYVYDKNPKKYADARPVRAIAWKSFRKIVGSKWDPGANVPFDPVASKLAEKLKLKVIIANGKNLPNLDEILHGRRFIGTTVS
jgi:uridylate kinase